MEWMRKTLVARVARARRAGHREAGMTLLEIMIVLAILALIMGFLVGPRVLRMLGEAKVDTAKLEAKDFVNAYAAWSMKAEDSCPKALTDLNAYRNKKAIKDPWKQEYIMRCGDNAPEDEPFGVLSKGPDKKENTADDVKSWE